MYDTLQAGISGGGSLPMYIDRFFEVRIFRQCFVEFIRICSWKYFVYVCVQAIGVKVQNGYGLTETSPVVAARRPNCNVRKIKFDPRRMIYTI